VTRNSVSGTINMGDGPKSVSNAQGWYDHEFGGVPLEKSTEETVAAAGAAGDGGADGAADVMGGQEGGENEETGNVIIQDNSELPGAAGGGAASKTNHKSYAWNWCALQLDDNREISASALFDTADGVVILEQGCIVIDQDSNRTKYESDVVTFKEQGHWRSTRTFQDYPTEWVLSVDGQDTELLLRAAFPDQELITLLSQPAFWEGKVIVSGKLDGEDVSGIGFVERSGFGSFDNLDKFFKNVGLEVRESVQRALPLEPTYEEARMLVCDEDRDDYMVGFDIGKYVETLIKPIREITDRGGKSWRSFGVLACCDCVGGDSRSFVKWMAMPEMLHCGSLMIDDIEDESETRRGGPCAHKIYGQALTINAGSAAYFLPQKLLEGCVDTDELKAKMYDLYFMALRAGHAGQALDIAGLDHLVDSVIESGDSKRLEDSVICIHRLKTAVPAATLARMGATVGEGSPEQIDAVGFFFLQTGVAFQIIDDVLNLRGMKKKDPKTGAVSQALKVLGEDIMAGKITMPVAMGFGLMKTKAERQALWDTVKAKPQDPAVVAECIASLEAVGAIDACQEIAIGQVDAAWEQLNGVIEDSFSKMLLRAFSFYLLQRHY